MTPVEEQLLKIRQEKYKRFIQGCEYDDQKANKSEKSHQCRKEVKFYIRYKNFKQNKEKNIYVCKKHKATLEKKFYKKWKTINFIIEAVNEFNIHFY